MDLQSTQTARVELLFSRYVRDLRRFLRRYVRDSADVEDCVQEAFLNVWREEKRGGLREDARGYLFTTALNVVRDRWRRDQVRQKSLHITLSDGAENLRSTEVETETAVLYKEGINLIEAELEKLRPSTRQVFLMHHVEHLAIPQIAARLGVSTRTVERELARALEQCQTALAGTLEDLLGC